MAPRWLSFSNEPGNRSSVLSVMSTTRRPTYDDPEQVANALNHPFFDQESVHDVLDSSAQEPATVNRTVSKKRYSLFARSIATTSDDSSEKPPSDHVRHWGRSPYHDDESASGVSRTHSRKSMASTTTRHEPILRWMRRVERSASSRPTTSSGPVDKMMSIDEVEREQRKASISSPFNFQHVTHTGPQQLPELEHVSDHDLTHTFWVVSAQQQPQGELRGIKAESVEEVQRQSRPPSSNIDSRPNSSGETVNFSRIRSSSVGRETAPRIRASRSLSNASAGSSEESRKTTGISRSASLASLIAEPRFPPTMVHPAFRSSCDAPPLPPPPMAWMQTSGLQTPPNELNRNLDVVPEEIESQSPLRVNAFDRLDKSPVLGRPDRTSVVSNNAHLSVTTVSSDGQGNLMSQYDISVPSLSSGETWEEDVDFCYNMEAESTCDFSYGPNPFDSPRPHDSVLAPSRKAQLDVDNHFDVSPRVSIAAHQRNRSSMTMTPFLSSTSKLDMESAFENPRSVPGVPLPEIKRLSSLLDMPMLKAPFFDAEDASPGKMSDQTVTNWSSSQVFKPDDVRLALSSFHLRSGPASAVRVNPPVGGVVYSDNSGTHRLSQVAKLSEQAYSPTSMAQMPSPPPNVPLPPIPTADCDRTSVAAKRATAPATRSATAPRQDHDTTTGTPSGNPLVKRSKSSPSANDLYRAHALPKTAEKFPVWI